MNARPVLSALMLSTLALSFACHSAPRSAPKGELFATVSLQFDT
jgi:hypothetical protein